MNAAALDVVENPFASAPVAARPGSSEVVVAAASAREIAEVQTSMVMARRFPRDEVTVVDRILQACTRPTLAEGALYEYARGGSDIRGPSIRLAECIAQYWGHLDFGWRVLEERPGATKVQTYAWDLQTGTRAKIDFDVTHERMAGGVKKILMDPRDIYEHIANMAARRKRACILAVVPGDVVEAATRQCEQTLRLKVEVTPERVQNMLAQFAELGVTKAQIEKRAQRRVEALTPGLLVALGKIYTSLRDGMSHPGDWFDTPPGDATGEPIAAATGAPGPREGASPRQAVRERLQARKTARQGPAEGVEGHTPAPTPQPAPARAPVQPTPIREPEPEPELYPHAHPEPATSEQALQDIVRFARAAVTHDDVHRVRNLAQQLTDQDEVLLAQQHIDAAVRRIGG